MASDKCSVYGKAMAEHGDPCIGSVMSFSSAIRRGKSIDITAHEGVVKQLRIVRQALVVEGRKATWVVLREEPYHAR